MIITPYLDSTEFLSGGKYYPNQTNFPALQHFFPCNEATGSTTLTDVINNVVVSGSASITNSGTGSISWASGNYNTIDSGTIQSPGTKDVVVIWAGKPTFSASRITFGSVATPGTTFGYRSQAILNTAGFVLAADENSGTTTDTGNASPDGASTVQGRAIGIDWSGTVQDFVYDPLDGPWNAGTPVDISSGGAVELTGITTIDQAIAFSTTSVPAFISVWHFTSLPSDDEIKAACAWMTDTAFSSGSNYAKIPYPGWRGRS